MAYRFRLGPALGKQLVRVVDEQIERALQASEDRNAGLAERVHGARTSCKRVRAALRLVRSLEPTLWRRENAWFRDSARELAALRDATVMPQTFGELLEGVGQEIDRRTCAGLRRQVLAQRRSVVRDAAANEKTLSHFAARMREAANRWAKLKCEAGATALLTRGFGQSYRRARRAWHCADAERSTNAFHDFRKRAKDHGYHCRLFRNAWPALMREWQGELSTLGDRLGAEHDLAVLDGWLRSVAPRAAGKNNPVARLRDVIRRRRDELREQSLLLGARLFAEKPREVPRRLSRWWQTAMELERTEAASRGSAGRK